MSDDTEKLLPCPFCGESGAVELMTAMGESWVACRHCNASGGMSSQAALAVKNWNARPYAVSGCGQHTGRKAEDASPAPNPARFVLTDLTL